ncbi:hypothetical protein YQE_01251, partial [Dendroctonus ponderosae]
MENLEEVLVWANRAFEGEKIVLILLPTKLEGFMLKKTKDVTSNIIIDTKAAVVKHDVVKISPSKTVSHKIETVQEVSSIVHVNSGPDANPQSKRPEIKHSPATRVNVISSKAVVAPIIVSKVQVIEEVKPAAKQHIITKVEVVSEAPKSIIASKVEVIAEEKPTRSVVEVKSDDEPAVIIGNNIGDPEYEFLSNQPSEVVEQTYKVINLRPSSKFQQKLRPSVDVKKQPTRRPDNPRPTGLVSKMEGMVVHDGIMTSYETSVIGTYINGKYAQVLQSTSQVFNHPKENPVRGKIAPTQSLTILKTAAPALKPHNKKQQHLEPTPAASINEDVSMAAADAFNAQNSIKSTRKPAKRFKNRPKEAETVEQRTEKETATSSQPTYKKPAKNRSSTRNSK